MVGVDGAQGKEGGDWDFRVTGANLGKFGIGERAMLLRTEHGNVLWDLFAYLDEATIEKVRRALWTGRRKMEDTLC